MKFNPPSGIRLQAVVGLVAVGLLGVAATAQHHVQGGGAASASGDASPTPTASTSELGEQDASTPTPTSTPAPTPTPAAARTAYRNGTYTATASYRTPESTESITVTLTVRNDVVTSATAQSQAVDRESASYQSRFKANFQSVVVGRPLATLELDSVAGSSLTSIGFNRAAAQIRNQAS